jgi:hypothetical protein
MSPLMQEEHITSKSCIADAMAPEAARSDPALTVAEPSTLQVDDVQAIALLQCCAVKDVQAVALQSMHKQTRRLLPEAHSDALVETWEHGRRKPDTRIRTCTRDSEQPAETTALPCRYWHLAGTSGQGASCRSELNTPAQRAWAGWSACHH